MISLTQPPAATFARRFAHFDAARTDLAAALTARLVERITASARKVEAPGNQIMCNACRGSGGWGCGHEAVRCEPCVGTGAVDVPVLPGRGVAK